MVEEKKLPEGYGAAAPYAKKGATKAVKGKGSYIDFIGKCRKSGKSMKQCALEWKKMAGRTNVRRRAARVLRQKRKIA